MPNTASTSSSVYGPTALPSITSASVRARTSSSTSSLASPLALAFMAGFDHLAACSTWPTVLSGPLYWPSYSPVGGTSPNTGAPSCMYAVIVLAQTTPAAVAISWKSNVRLPFHLPDKASCGVGALPQHGCTSGEAFL